MGPLELRATLHADRPASEGTGNEGKGSGDGWVALELRVTNCGAMAAAEVVQVYLEPPGQHPERAPRSLVGFQRLQLSAGETRCIGLTISLRRLAWFDPDRDGFVLEEGLHRLVVARHVEDGGLAVALALQATFLGP